MLKKIFTIFGIAACVALSTQTLAASFQQGGLPGVFIDPLGQQTPAVDAPQADTPSSGLSGFSHPTDLQLDDSITIAEGIYAGPIELSGLHPSQAKEAIEDYYNAIGSSVMTIGAAGSEFNATPEQFGFEFNTEGVVEEASFLGQYGSLVERYKSLMDLKYDKVVMDIECTLDSSLVNEYVETAICALNAEPKSATITRKNGSFEITESVTGIQVDTEATVRAIMDVFHNDMSTHMRAEAAVLVTEPKVKTEQLQTITSVLGSYSTSYSDSKPGRKTNIKVGSGRINGTLLMPGETFSTSKTMLERTPENGYALATEYLNGENVDAYGGGVCQISTTLYNAVLRAELEVNERHPHSMKVSYVEPSFDAAISWGVYDFRFTNNLENPVYITSSCDGATLTFTIYGQETRPSYRKVEFSNVILEYVKSEPIMKEDPTQYTDYVLSTGSAHDGVTSYLVKKVYENGKVVDTIKFATDTYRLTQKTITKGTMPLPDAPTEPVEGGEDPGQPEPGGDTGSENTGE